MKKRLISAGSALAATIIAACSSCTTSETLPHVPATPPETAVTDRTAFAEGADISWVTEMESRDMKFYDADGNETECTALMKKLGFDSIRLRVWVNPEAGWNSAADVLIKAMRAQKLGMRIMIDFHYSDTWADPGSQKTPAAWDGLDIDGLVKAVSDHTTEVLSLLKKYGVEVEWVQVGNETRNGMLYQDSTGADRAGGGNYKENGGRNYALLTNAGYDAAKTVYPDCKVIVHLDGGHNISLYSRIFPVLDANGGKYDMIGMSLYPSWWDDSIGGYGDWKANTDACIANISTVSRSYGKDVMICETGMPVSDPETAKSMLSYLLEKAKELECCKGVFYWEPQAPAGYNDGYQLGAFENGKATAALDPFHD